MDELEVITPKSIFEMSDENKIAQIERDYEHAKEDVTKKSVNWKEYFDYYLGTSQPRTQPETGHQLASIFIPKIGEKIDWLAAKVMQAMYNYRPIVNIRANHTKFRRPAELLEEVCDYQFFKIPQIWRKTNDMVKEACIYNTGVWKIFWDNKLNQPTIDCIPRKDFYPDPFGRYIDECRYAIQRAHKSKEELWANRESDGGVYKDSVLQELFEYNTTVTEEEGGRQDQQVAQDEPLPESKEGRYEIIEYWTRKGLITTALWSKDTKLESGAIESQHGMLIIREDKDLMKMNKLPFRCWVYNPKPHEFDGLGVVAVSKDLQDEYNTGRRQMIDHRSFTIKPETMMPDKALSDPEEDKLRKHTAGQVIKYKFDKCPPGSIYPLKISPLQNDTLASIQMAAGDIDHRTGIYQHAQGEQFQRKETATTTVSLLQRADLLFANIFQGFAAQVLKPTFEMMVELNQNFLKGEIQSSNIRISDEKNAAYYVFTKKDIKGDFDYEVNVAAIMGSNEMTRAQYMQVWGMFSNNPELAMAIGIDLKKLAKEILATFDNIKNPEDLFLKQQAPQQPGIQGMPGMMGGGQGMGGGMGMNMPPGMGRGQRMGIPPGNLRAPMQKMMSY